MQIYSNYDRGQAKVKNSFFIVFLSHSVFSHVNELGDSVCLFAACLPLSLSLSFPLLEWATKRLKRTRITNTSRKHFLDKSQQDIQPIKGHDFQTRPEDCRFKTKRQHTHTNLREF